MKLRVLGVCLLLILSLQNIGCSFIFRPYQTVERFFFSPSRTVELFFTHLEKGELDDAIKLKSKTSIEQEGVINLKNRLATVPSSVKNAGGIKNFEIINEETIGEVSEIIFLVEYNSAESFHYKATLIKENNEWKVDKLSSAESED
jgi:hypothetical protein